MMDVKTLSGAFDYLLLEIVVVSDSGLRVFAQYDSNIETCHIAWSLMENLVH